jgi:hypothetical protein
MPGKHQVYFTVTPAEDLILESVQQSNKHEEDVEDDDVERYKIISIFLPTFGIEFYNIRQLLKR